MEFSADEGYLPEAAGQSLADDRGPKTGDRRPTTENTFCSAAVNGCRSTVVGRRKRALLIGLLLLTINGSTPPTASASMPLTIKFATLAPEGTTWMLVLREMDAEIQQRTGGRIRFVFYPGGVGGDEIDVLRKIRIGQLHGGAFSGVGLGSVLPSVRVLELPMLFRDTGEVDFVTGRLEAQFSRAFAKRGFILLAFAEAGFVHIFSKKAIHRREDLGGVKIWAWQGDPLAAALLQTYQVAPIPLALPEVLPSLQTGLINAFYAPPLAAIAFQWFSQVSYISAEGLTHAIGSMLISRSRWAAIPADLQKTLKEVTKKYAQKVVAKTRQENQEALVVLARHGIKTVDLDPGERRRFLDVSRQVWDGQAGRLYPRALLDKVQSLLRQYRGDRP
ncbi:MAG: TRAP transporter substrate-binding protein DctP [Candidatus Methylomirabilales bacterium]